MDVGKPKKSRPKRMKVHDDDSENELEIGHKDSDAPVAMSGIGKKPKKGAKPMKLNVKHHKEPQLELGVDPDHGSMSTALGHEDSNFDPNTEMSSLGKDPSVPARSAPKALSMKKKKRRKAGKVDIDDNDPESLDLRQQHSTDDRSFDPHTQMR